MMKSQHAVLGAGPLGLATVAALQRQSAPALLVSRHRPDSLDSAVRHQALDLRDVPALSALLRGCHTAYFCAQPHYHRWSQDFPPLLDAVLQACEQVGCALVLADNLYGYGLPAQGQPLSEASLLGAVTRKGRVRAAMAAQALAAHKTGQVQVSIARASDFFGPGVLASALGERVWRPLLAGGSVRFAGDADQLHSYAFIDDFAEALVHLGLRGGGWGEVWHVPHQPLMSTRQLLAQAASAHGLKAPRIVQEGRLTLRLAGLFVPAAREVIEMLPQFECRYAVDDTRWTRLRGSGATSLDEALDRTWRWYAGARSHAVAAA